MTDNAPEQHAASDHMNANPFSDPAAPLDVRVRLERWDDDNAVEIGSIEFDGRAVFDAQHLDTIGDHYSDLDWVFYTAITAGLIDNHDGPFTVYVPEELAEYIAHRESAGMNEPYPSAAASLAAARLDLLRTKLEEATAEVERLRAEIAEAEKAGSVERGERFTITELDPCSCGMRRFLVEDSSDHTSQIAHVGLLNHHDLGHNAVSTLLRAERKARRNGENGGER